MTTSSELPNFSNLWNYSDPAATEKQFREILIEAEAAGDESYCGQLLTQIARAEGLQQNFDQAHATLDSVAARLDGLPDVVRLRYLLERGRVFNSSGKADQARPLFEQAWNLGQQSGEDCLAVDAAHMMAIVEPADQAIDWSERAIAYAEKSKDEAARNWLGPLYNNLGWTYHDQREFEKALDIHQRALAWREEKGNMGPIRIARWSVARVLRSLGRVDEAIEMQQTLLQELDTANEQDGFVYEELAECHLVQGREAQATPLFAQAYELLSQDIWLVKQEPDRIARLKQLGQVED
jgi:tetratricopeptide (TPR) repeat protein